MLEHYTCPCGTEVTRRQSELPHICLECEEERLLCQQPCQRCGGSQVLEHPLGFPVDPCPGCTSGEAGGCVVRIIGTRVRDFTVEKYSGYPMSPGGVLPVLGLGPTLVKYYELTVVDEQHRETSMTVHEHDYKYNYVKCWENLEARHKEMYS